MTLVVPSASLATFQQFPQLSFTMTTGGSNPLPQSLLMDSTGASTRATYVESTGVGGNWLSIQSPCFNCSTPAPISVAINGSALDAGFYVGQVVVSNSTWSMVIPVTLAVIDPGGPMLGPVPGGMSFVTGNGFVASSENIQLNNISSGSLTWAASISCSRGNSAGVATWLSISANNGTVPSALAVTISPQGLSSGNYFAEVIVQSGGVSQSVPITLVVTSTALATFHQLPELNFIAVAGSSSPLSQTLEIPSTGASISTFELFASATGGSSWLSVTAPCFNCSTPIGISVNVNSTNLPVGVYAGQVYVVGATTSSTVSVTLSVIDLSAPSLGPVPGALNFVSASGSGVGPLTIPINNVGTGSLNWTLSDATFRGTTTGSAAWLSVSSSSGTAPSIVTVTTSAEGLTPGTYLGQITLQSLSANVSIPVVLVVGDSKNVTFQEFLD